MCEYCKREFNKTYLSKHIERCLINKLHSNDTAKLASHSIININDENHIKINFIKNNDEHNNDENN